MGKCKHGNDAQTCPMQHPDEVLGDGMAPVQVRWSEPVGTVSDRDPEARARKIVSMWVTGDQKSDLSTSGRYWLEDAIATALEAERLRALEDAAKAAEDRCGSCYCSDEFGVWCAQDIRALMGKP